MTVYFIVASLLVMGGLLGMTEAARVRAYGVFTLATLALACGMIAIVGVLFL